MKRLIQKGLMFGNLFAVDSPALVARYNRALKKLTGHETKLEEFYVDISGYSPEVGEELGDHLYLNQGGCNRQFILLSPEQKRAPLLGAKFSTSRGILRGFIDANEAQIFALTARDALAGELMNSVYRLDSPARLFDLRKITVEADTTEGSLAGVAVLAARVDRFMAQENAWYDEALIGEMIDLSRQAGDFARVPVQLEHTEFEQGDFWTAHFGGLYVLRDLAQPAVIAPDADDLGPVPVERVIDIADRNAIARYLADNGLVEPIVKARGVDAAAILRQKMEFIAVDAVAGQDGVEIGNDANVLHRLARRYGEALPEAFYGLEAMLRWATGTGKWPNITSEHPAYFYTLRAADVPQRDLINMLLAQLAPKDIRQLFICHKGLFYKLYAGWPEAKKAYVAEYLQRAYQADKAGARAALFAHDAPMDDSGPPPREDLVTRVGPWGAVAAARARRVKRATSGPWDKTGDKTGDRASDRASGRSGDKSPDKPEKWGKKSGKSKSKSKEKRR